MRRLVIAAAVLLTAGSASAAALPPDLAAAAHAYDQAQIKSDKAELERLVADDYVLQNSSGQVQDKTGFIADSVAPGFKIEPFTARLRFMDVWAKRGGQWRVIFTQATRAPAS